LDIKIEDVGESFYNSRIPDTVKELKDKGLVTEDKGAQCIFLKNF
jgi:arginyl-tRNA synthetase